MSEHMLKVVLKVNAEEFAKAVFKEFSAGRKSKKEMPSMQVSYNGFTGELAKLEQKTVSCYGEMALAGVYDLSIYDSEKQVTCSFTGVKLENVKFLGGAVSFSE